MIMKSSSYKELEITDFKSLHKFIKGWCDSELLCQSRGIVIFVFRLNDKYISIWFRITQIYEVGIDEAINRVINGIYTEYVKEHFEIDDLYHQDINVMVK